jgi:hypothetical protein
MLAILTALLACTPKDGETSCVVEDEAGAASAVVNGGDWTGGDATWMRQGSTSAQINTANAGAGWLSIVAQTTTEGEDVLVAIDAGAFPVTVSLVDGGWATFYPSSGASFSSKEGAGELVIADVVEGGLMACFTFTASGDDGTVEVDAGTIHAKLTGE